MSDSLHHLERCAPGIVLLLCATISCLAAPAALAQDAGMAPRPSLRAVRIRDGDVEPRIDGILDDASWDGAAVARGFTQREPRPGMPASQPTEARVLYGADALFVAIRAFDSAPDSIVAELTRRDADERSDRVGFAVDSYLDRRSAFRFTVNPRGVKTDVHHYDDVEEDGRWDPVWDVATRVDEQGWTAEFRVPYSQLRFGEEDEQTWGIQFHRDIARLDEVSLWAPTRPDDGALVSRFGNLEGLENIRRPVRVEVLPYAMSRLREGVVPEDPTARESQAAGGVDVKYGLSNNFTLDVTVNPDFGQVEADPARVNLTAFESFYPERRPFFQEASNLFDFQISLADGDEDLETLFYSRRVGRQPQGFSSGDARFASPSEQTTIQGAVKLTGRTSGGWSVGVLAAETAEESAQTLGEQGVRGAAVVEPRTHYSVARVVRDLRQGRSAVGVIATGVVREEEAADGLALPVRAFAGGLDVRHRFGGDRFELRGWALASRLEGSAQAVSRAQTSAVHLFQRPDATHLTFDPGRTALNGYAANLALQRLAGGSWRGKVGVHLRSPGFDVGDAGFQRMSDIRIAFAEVGYERSKPQGPFRSWEVYSTHWGAYSHGNERLERGGNVRGEFLMRNLWGGWWGVEYNLEGLTPWMLRGGPGFRREGELLGWGGVFSDGRRRLGGRLEGSWSVRPESDSWGWEIRPSLTWRPTPVATLRAGPFASSQVEDRQWIGAAGQEPTYVFGRMEQRTVGAVLRADLAFSPTLSLQVFAQPFVSAGSFSHIREVSDPRAPRYERRFADLGAERGPDAGLLVDLDGDGEAERYDNPDFNFRRLRTNTVLRWEYRPGSTLYLVWSQGREEVLDDGTFRPVRDLRGLLSTRSDDALMVKVTYWWTP
ncbi:MAG: DUF5916 domain-containing protein [Gemmatimonadota bacterium]|jgi:hypothetical protein